MSGYDPSTGVNNNSVLLHEGDKVVVEIKNRLVEAVIVDIYPDPRKPQEATNVLVTYETWWGKKTKWINGYYVRGIEPKET